MPWRLSPSNKRCVQVEKGGEWRELKCHESTEKAKAHLAALHFNAEKGVTLLSGEITKTDPDKELMFGWGSVAVDKDGAPVVDSQDDVLAFDVNSLEDAVYAYVEKSGQGRDMHEAVGTGQLVESFMVTPEKLEKMGLAKDALPIGWWVGYKVTDPEAWKAVKAGERLGFSIKGTGRRVPI